MGDEGLEDTADDDDVDEDDGNCQKQISGMMPTSTTRMRTVRTNVENIGDESPANDADADEADEDDESVS